MDEATRKAILDLYERSVALREMVEASKSAGPGTLDPAFAHTFDRITQAITDAVTAAIEAAGNRSIPFEYKLWTVEHIAEYLNRNISTVRDTVLCLPDFPRPFRLPARTKAGHALYKASEVIEWVEGHREGGKRIRQRRRKTPNTVTSSAGE